MRTRPRVYLLPVMVSFSSSRRMMAFRLRRRGLTGAIAPEQKVIRLQQSCLEISRDPANIESRAESAIVREVGRNDEARRLRVKQPEVWVPNAGWCLIGHLGGGAVVGCDSIGGEGDVLLEPEEVGGDWGAVIGDCVD